MNAMTDMRKFSGNFVAHLRMLSQHRPHDTALIVVSEQDGVTVDSAIDYATLDRRVRALAALLQQRFDKGERALLLLDNDDHYVVAFFACLYAGLIAVPVFPPESARRQHLERLTGIAADAQACCVLTGSFLVAMTGMDADTFGADMIVVDTVDANLAECWAQHVPADDDIAFLQYTSGSTSAPKGVMISHGNLMANERAIEEGLSIAADDVFVSWLPLYHDMGLIGGLLQPIYNGMPLVLMTPRFFLERPVRWLEAMSRHRGTISAGPDFAYRLCVDRVTAAQSKDLDLSHWRVALSGAEPVRHDTLQKFIARFADAGFRADAVYPSYGLAEATLFVTGGRRGDGMTAQAFSDTGLANGQVAVDEHGTMLVGCGRTVSDHTVEIVDAQSCTPVEAGRIGEIWVSGPSISRGYWNKPQQTKETFVERDGRTWLRSGDLGFQCDGQLHIAGRIKDLIIVRGYNLYPQDIEAAVEANVDTVRKGRVAAFGVQNSNGDGIGIAVEIARNVQKSMRPAEIVEALGIAVGNLCGESLSVVVLLNPGGLPKTSSGKLQRAACRLGWNNGSLDAYAICENGRFVSGNDACSEAPIEALKDECETALADIWQQVLQSNGNERDSENIRPSRDMHFFTGGGNSLTAVQVASRIADRWGIEFPVSALFEYPRLADCAAEIKRRRDSGTLLRRTAIPVLPAAHGVQWLPLSHAQQRLWFLWQINPSSRAYHIAGTLHLSGRLDPDAVIESFRIIAMRHVSLRTVFRATGDELVQQAILPELHPTIEIVDLRDAEVDRCAIRTQEEITRIHDAPFDPANGPLLRIGIVHQAEDRHALAVVMHHIVSDGWSVQLILNEFAAIYRALIEKKEVVLPALPIRYVDYAVWQRQWLDSGESARQLAWWRAQLGDEHPVLELPVDHPRSAAANYRAEHYEVVLPAALSDALRTAARNNGATVFMMLLAAFQTLLQRHTGQNDIRIGATANNRTSVQTEGVVGFFVNAQVLRGQLNSRTPLMEVLKQARETAIGAQAHQDLPFEQLVEALQPGRDLSHSPLFRVLINHQQTDHRVLMQLPELRFDGLEPAEQAARFELALDTTERPDGSISARFIYAAELFEPDTIRRLASHYLRVLQAFAHAPDFTVGEIALLDDVEHNRLTRAGRPRLAADAHATACTLHQLIEQQAVLRPHAIALTDGERAFSYAELNMRANRLAHALIARGVRAEGRIGLAAGRCADLVIAIVGILKAGAAYVPLDPGYPAERLTYMMADSGMQWLLVQQDVQSRMPLNPGLHVLNLDALLNADDADDATKRNPDVPLSDASLAYIIYTSGSTGRPKGAQLCHRNVARLLSTTDDWFGFDHTDVWTLFHSYAFDFSVWEIFGALCNGGRLVIVPFAVSRSPDEFLTLLQAQGVTILNQTPSAFRQLLQLPQLYREQTTSLRAVIFGGEALEPEDLRPWIAHFGDEQTQLINMYGITETTVHVTWRRITAQDLASRRSPIGCAIPDLGLYVLDDRLNPAPINVPGELHVSGAGLARGYLNRPGLSAERFIADPFDTDGGRLYRTGDLARWRDDGEIEYLGRIDDQIKLRGFRIELGEIDARLRECTEVRDAVVMVRNGAAGDQRLVAYVVPDREQLRAGHRGEQAGKTTSGTMVEQWESVFDSTYAGEEIAPSFRGWNDSYADAPIPQVEMQEWLDCTVQRIAQLKPARVLEIGCGVGLLVQHIAPLAERYLGTDLSPRAVADLQRWLATQKKFDHVELRQREGADFSGIEHAAYDTMILNSVAQYFPDADYLLEVLRGAAKAVGPQGKLFVGDLRHLAHLPLFHASVQLFKAEPDVTLQQLRMRVERAVSQEKELVLDPAFFHAVAAHFGLQGARILLHRGHFDNELTRYRYDVVIGATSAHAQPAAEAIEWSASSECERIGELLAAARPSTLHVRNVPNRRLSRDLATWQLLQQGDAHETVRDLQRRLDALAPSGIDPEAFWKLGDKYGYDVQIGWSPDATDGRFDVAFVLHTVQQTSPAISSMTLPEDWRRWATDPLVNNLILGLGARLRDRLSQQLPTYMVPGSFVMLEAMPLTSNGKLDRKALPEPEGAVSGEYEAPLGDVEIALAAIWREILGAERVGRADNFFELGGHSLLATQLMSRVRATLHVELPLRLVFERPVLRNLAEHVRQTLAENGELQPQHALQPVERTAAMSLSPVQRRLWLVDRLAGSTQERAAYNMAAALELNGPLDTRALQATLAALMQRHEILRTRYPENDDGEPIAVIDAIEPEATLDIAITDLSNRPPAQHAELVEQALAQHAARVFDLAAGPVLRVALLRLDAQRHVLLFCIHHIAFDGWSKAVFAREFVALYQNVIHQGITDSATPQLPPLAVQYADYAQWHAEKLDATAEMENAFWRDYLNGVPAISTLPHDRDLPDATSSGAVLQTDIPKQLADALARIARQHDTSLFTVLLASHLFLLHRLAGADDLVIGTDVAGRNHPDLEGLIGFFVNVVPLRSRFSADATFTEWLAQVRENTLTALEHQDMPLDQIVEAAGAPRMRNRNPLVQMLFVLQNIPSGRFDIDGLEVRLVPQPVTQSKFDLALFVNETTHGLNIEWVYATALYRRETVEQVAVAWHSLLQQIAAAPESLLKNFAIPAIKETTMINQPTPTPASNKPGKLDKLKKIAGARTASGAPRVPVRMSFLADERQFPLVIEASGNDIDPIAWAKGQRDFIETALGKHGGILFRNFGLKTPQDFEAFAEVIEPQLYGDYGDLPKKEGGNKTYRSTPYPERQMILYHNESSHLDRWPRKQWFFCELPSPVGGATPIVDCREMLRRLPSGLAAEFERRQLLYIRTFTPRLDVSWQDFFKTDSRADVEARLHKAGIEWQWYGDDELQTRTRCPAVIRHPVTGERVFFNQVQLHHTSCLEPEVRDDLLALVGHERMPRNVCFGDGEPIPDDVMAVIGRTYEECAVRFQWQQGDIIMLDNMLAAHARDPFEGPRKIVVAMGEMFDRAALDARQASAADDQTNAASEVV